MRMPKLFLKSAGCYLSCWLRSFLPGRHPGAPLNGRRFVFLLLLFPPFLALQLLHALAWLLDEVLFPGYRRVELRAPVFVTGLPRSGTTFVHRTLAADPRFCSFSTWEALLAPTVLERRLLRAAARIDRRLGGPLRRTVDRVLKQFGGDFDSVHAVRRDAPEEDYLALLPFSGCFLLVLAFPFCRGFSALGRFDQVPKAAREPLLEAYHRCLQKQLFCAPPGKRLLSKNAAFGSWVPDLARRYPDARFLLCIRDPLDGLSSQLSSVAGGRRFFGTDPDDEAFARLFTDTFAHNYAGLADFTARAPAGRFAILDQGRLRRDPRRTLGLALEASGIEPDGTLRARVDSLEPAKPSAHAHDPGEFPLDPEQIEVCISPAYRKMLERSP